MKWWLSTSLFRQRQRENEKDLTCYFFGAEVGPSGKKKEDKRGKTAKLDEIKKKKSFSITQLSSLFGFKLKHYGLFEISVVL